MFQVQKMGSPNYNKWLLLAGLFFTIHNIEEAIGTAHFVLPPNIKLPIVLPGAVPMIWSIILITVIAWLVILWAVSRSNEVPKRNILTFLFFLFLVNAVFPHIVVSAILGMYTPALITSVFIYVPLGLYGFMKMYQQFDNKSKLYMVLTVCTIVTLIVVVALHRITTLILS